LVYTHAGAYYLYATGASIITTPQDAGVVRTYSLLAAFAAYVVTGNSAMLLYAKAPTPPTPAVSRLGGESWRAVRKLPVVDEQERQARLALVLFDFMDDE
jgi:hypothetical protein